MHNLQIIQGDARQALKSIPAASVQMIMTSPPYYGLRDYHVPGQIGLEREPKDYVASLVEVFREARRVLRDDGTLWLNLGDSFTSNGGHTDTACNQRRGQYNIGNRPDEKREFRARGLKPKDLIGIPWRVAFALQEDGWYLRQWMPWVKRNATPESCADRPSSSCEIIFLLTKSADYFYDTAAVRKPPSEALLKQVMEGYAGESTKDFFGAQAQDASGTKGRIIAGFRKKMGFGVPPLGGAEIPPEGGTLNADDQMVCGSQRRNGDWLLDSLKGMLTDEAGDPLAFVVNTASFKESHFATYPPALVRPCIMAGTSAAGCCPKCGAPWERLQEAQKVSDESASVRNKSQSTEVFARGGNTVQFGRAGDYSSVTIGWHPSCECNAGQPIPCTVLDPFFGSGTTGQVALELGRRCIGIELNPAYIQMAATRTNVTPGLPTL